VNELSQNVDLLYKLSPFIFASCAQYIAFRLLKRDFEAHVEQYKEDKRTHKEERDLQWAKFDKLKESIDHLNASMARLTTILEVKNHVPQKGMDL
jgi:septal ring factor EnvC (AmiA/AmiB activator)